MTPVYVTFTPREDGAFLITTFAHGQSDPVETAEATLLTGARGAIEGSILAALSGDGVYPYVEALAMHNSLNWDSSLQEIRLACPSWIKLRMGAESWPLLPELVPISQDAWLDQLAPCYRTLRHAGYSQGKRVSGSSVAILAQEGDQIDFPSWAEDAANAFRELGIRVSVFLGGELANEPTRRFKLLQQIFYEHRAVIFLGHLERSIDGRTWGWGLTPRNPLPMADLRKFLGTASQDSSGYGIRVPEIVFAGCCAGAWRDPRRQNLFYPSLFLDAGVRYFVGAWVNIAGPSEPLLRRTVVDLAVEFLGRAVVQPDHAVHHLYEAKRKLGFPLLSSLFQIYTLGGGDILPPPVQEEKPSPQEVEVVPPAETRSVPRGGIISSVSTGDRLSSYLLGQQLWTDSYSRTFWANSENGNHLVQILTDEWQGDSKLQGEMESAIDKLHKVSLSAHHLVPARAELCARSFGESGMQNLLVLVYDRPDAELPGNWMTLHALRFDASRRDHFMVVLHLGAGFAQLLSELHEQKIQHGNLDPDSIVFYRAPADDREMQVHIKDAWLRHTPPGRCTRPRYGAPEEQSLAEGGEELKADCWGLGVILYELATGSSPFSEEEAGMAGPRPSIKEHFGEQGFRVPEALERVVRDCLLPSAALRPSADLVWRRLMVALATRGANLSTFDALLWAYIQAGQRLFAVVIDDRADLEPSLDAIADRGHPVYVLEEGQGLIHRKTKLQISPWISADELDESSALRARQEGKDLPPSTTFGEALAINAYIVFGEASLGPPPGPAEPEASEQPRSWREVVRQFRFESETRTLVEPGEGVSGGKGLSPPPVVLLFGNGWWDDASPQQQIAIHRMLRLCQNELGSPVVILAGNYLWLDIELSRSFRWLRFPSVAQADIFDRLLSAHRTEALQIPPVEGPMAIKLARSLFPCTGRQLTAAMRMCALQWGAIDEHIIEVRDELREDSLRHAGTVTYLPVSRLPEPGSMGLPRNIQGVIVSWAAASQAVVRGDTGAAAPRRILITGASGYGKTSLALAFGSLSRRPVIRIEVARCLQKDLGASEQLLRRTLNEVSNIPGAIALLDDVDRIFGSQTDDRDATIQRMSSYFLRWVDDLPLSLCVVLTAPARGALPAQWQRRIDLHIGLDDPIDLNNHGYRQAVFEAVFRKCGLLEAAGDAELTAELARGTDPRAADPPIVYSPSALLAVSGLRDQTVWLDTPAAIEIWIQENILLNAGRKDVDISGAAFWRSTLRFR